MFSRARTWACFVLLATLLFLLIGCPPPPPTTLPLIIEKQTDQQGTAVLNTNFGIVYASVQDENGLPIHEAFVSSYELEDRVVVVASHEDAAPSIKILNRGDFTLAAVSQLSPGSKPQVAWVTIIFVLITIADVGITIYEYEKTPDEIPIQWPGIIEGSRRVRSMCVQIDANDILAIAGLVRAGLRLSKAVLVFGVAAKIRGVTAIRLGFTKKAVERYLVSKTLRELGKKIAEYLGLLHTDLINTCDYIYEDEKGNLYTLPLQKWEIIRADVPACTIIVDHGKSVQAAIDGAPSGAVICLSEGTWQENVTIQKSLVLRGTNQGQTFIQGTQGTRESERLCIVCVVGIPESIEVNLEKLTIKPKTSPTMAAQPGQPGIVGIGIGGYAKVQLNQSHISKNIVGIGVGGFAQLTVFDSLISENQCAGISVGASTQIRILNSQISKNGSTTCNFAGVDSSGIHIVVDAAQIFIQDSQISNNNGNGIFVVSGNPSTKLELYDNHIFNNQGYGIGLALRGCIPEDWKEDSFKGKIEGSNNQIFNNTRGNLCPANYAWPYNFVALSLIAR